MIDGEENDVLAPKFNNICQPNKISFGNYHNASTWSSNISKKQFVLAKDTPSMIKYRYIVRYLAHLLLPQIPRFASNLYLEIVRGPY